MNIVLTISPEEYGTILNPNPKYVHREFIKYPPLSLLAIVRNVNPKHKIIIYDTSEYSIEELINNIISEKPDVLGISAITEKFYGVLALAREVKKYLPNTTIILGGPHISLYPHETMTHSAIDYVLSGACELTFPLFMDWLDNKKNMDIELIHNLYYKESGGTIKYTQTNIVKCLDGYPFPDRRRIDLKKYVSLSDRSTMTTMNSSRGCPFRCVFCNVPRYYATGSPEHIVGEIEEILSLGFNEIYILDDTFNINRNRVLEICSLIKKKRLKFKWSTRARLKPFDDEMASAMTEAGCFRLSVGVESHNPTILKYIKKGICLEDIIKGFEIIHKHKLETNAYFIVGYPNQTVEDALATTDFIKIIKPTFILMNTLIALPFSDFYMDLVKSGIYQKDYWREFVLNPTKDYMLPSWRDKGMDEVFMDIRDKIMKDFYLSPSFVMKETWKDISHLRFEQLGKKIHIGIKMMGGKLK